MLTASQYILKSLTPDEELQCVVSSSVTNHIEPDIAITTKRIFARYDDGRTLSFPLEKIKQIALVRDKDIFGNTTNTGIVNIMGPYNRIISIESNNLQETRALLEHYISFIK